MRPRDAQNDAVSQSKEAHALSPELNELLQVIGELLGDIFLEKENEN